MSTTLIDPTAVHAGLAALVPELAAQAGAADRDRRVAPEVAARLRALGAHRLLQPAAHGGAEASVVDHVRAVATAAEGCVAAAWCLAVWSVHDWMLALHPAGAQASVWGERPDALISGSIVPRTPFENDGPDHVLVRGRFGFTSGVDNADAVLLGGLVERDGRPAAAQVVVPMAAASVDQDTWHVMALRGTGSKDTVVERAWRVRRDDVLFLDDAVERHGAGVHPGPLYRAPYRSVGILVLAPPALGAARAALARFIARLDGHQMTLSRTVQRLDPAARLRVAESAAEIDAAERTLIAAAELCDELGRRGSDDPVLVARVGRDAAFAVRLCAQAVDRLFEAAGGSALSEAEPLQRLWRDVHGARQHAVLTWDGVAGAYADALLGPA